MPTSYTHILYCQLCQEHSLLLWLLVYFLLWVFVTCASSALVCVDTGSCPVSSAPSPALVLNNHLCVCRSLAPTLAPLHLCHLEWQQLCRFDKSVEYSLLFLPFHIWVFLHSFLPEVVPHSWRVGIHVLDLSTKSYNLISVWSGRLRACLTYFKSYEFKIRLNNQVVQFNIWLVLHA